MDRFQPVIRPLVADHPTFHRRPNLYTLSRSAQRGWVAALVTGQMLDDSVAPAQTQALRYSHAGRQDRRQEADEETARRLLLTPPFGTIAEAQALGSAIAEGPCPPK